MFASDMSFKVVQAFQSGNLKSMFEHLNFVTHPGSA